MYKKEVPKAYQKPNFDEYHKRMEEEKVNKLALEKKMPVVEIQGDPYYQIAEQHNNEIMKKNLDYNVDEKM